MTPAKTALTIAAGALIVWTPVLLAMAIAPPAHTPALSTEAPLPTRQGEAYVSLGPELIAQLDRSRLTLRVELVALIADGEGARVLRTLLAEDGQRLRAALLDRLNSEIGPGPFDRNSMASAVAQVSADVLAALPGMPEGAVREVLIPALQMQ